MVDKKRFRKKFLLGLLSSPLVLGPLVVGLTLLLTAWTFSLRSSVLVLGGLAGVLGAVGMAVTRGLFQDRRLAEAAVGELQREAQEQTDRELDDLDHRLVEDGDQRTEDLFRDLRALAQAFRDGQTWASEVNPRSAFDILAGVDELFAGCVRALQQTLELWRAAEKMATPAAAEPIRAQRERIIQDVRQSIGQLGRLLAGLQGFRSGAQADSELARLRAELDQSLDVARRVEQRMKDWSYERKSAE